MEMVFHQTQLGVDGLMNLIGFGVAAASFGWLSYAGWRSFPPLTGSAAYVGRLLLPDPGRNTGLSRFYRARIHRDNAPVASLRHPLVRRPDWVLSTSPTAVDVAFSVLVEALDHPLAPTGLATALMAGGKPPRQGIPQSPMRAHVLGDLASRHAWLETACVTLMVRNRERGSWLRPADLDVVLTEEPALAAALRMGCEGEVAPEGAGIVAHWQAERSGNTRIAHPRVVPALDVIGEPT